MAKPKHDYDSEDFYKRIEGLAMNGYTDEEIANELNLCREVFTCMKNGNYENWTDEENKRRGETIRGMKYKEKRLGETKRKSTGKGKKPKTKTENVGGSSGKKKAV